MTRRKVEACPFDARTRATKCEDCCARSGGLTPCVAAWLAAKTGLVELLEPADATRARALPRRLARAA